MDKPNASTSSRVSCGSPIGATAQTEFEKAWAEYFAEHPEILASWNHQNGYWPPGHGEE